MMIKRPIRSTKPTPTDLTPHRLKITVSDHEGPNRRKTQKRIAALTRISTPLESNYNSTGMVEATVNGEQRERTQLTTLNRTSATQKKDLE